MSFLNQFFKKRINIILVSVAVTLFIMIGLPFLVKFFQVDTSKKADVIVATTFTANYGDHTRPSYTKPPEVGIIPETVKVKTDGELSFENNATEPSERELGNSNGTTATQKSTESTTNKSNVIKVTEPTTASIPFATAAKGDKKVPYSKQWNEGYLVAVDYPDRNYYCSHVELTDENRDLIERLCMGEFSTGGFTGAALIAQAVKNAMDLYGYTSVRDVIKDFHYTGRLNVKPSKAVKDAVIYIFDMDKDAVQHRILYMYNPKVKQSAFHESRRYICTFKNVRFFDR